MANTGSEDTGHLLDLIVNCPVVRDHFEESLSACSKVIETQDHTDLPFQVPEPWSGRIESAPILFISSNPSIGDADEEYPDTTWSAERTRDFFQYRFGGGPGGFNPIADGVRPPRKDGGHRRSVPFWRTVKQHSEAILGHEAVPGVHYALTEIVHCKSREEQGVKAASKECVRRYLDPVVAISGASVIVVLGAFAREAIWKHFGEPFAEKPTTGDVIRMELGSRTRLVAFMPHPNAHMERSMTAVMEPRQLARLRKVAGPQPVITDSPEIRRLRLMEHGSNRTLGNFSLHDDGAVTAEPSDGGILCGLWKRSKCQSGRDLFTWADGWSNGYIGTQEVPVT